MKPLFKEGKTYILSDGKTYFCTKILRGGKVWKALMHQINPPDNISYLDNVWYVNLYDGKIELGEGGYSDVYYPILAETFEPDNNAALQNAFGFDDLHDICVFAIDGMVRGCADEKSIPNDDWHDTVKKLKKARDYYGLLHREQIANRMRNNSTKK